MTDTQILTEISSNSGLSQPAGRERHSIMLLAVSVTARSTEIIVAVTEACVAAGVRIPLAIVEVVVRSKQESWIRDKGSGWITDGRT